MSWRSLTVIATSCREVNAAGLAMTGAFTCRGSRSCSGSRNEATTMSTYSGGQSLAYFRSRIARTTSRTQRARGIFAGPADRTRGAAGKCS